MLQYKVLMGFGCLKEELVNPPMLLATTTLWRRTEPLLRKTFEKWSRDPVPRFGAALSYYTAFAIVPLVVLLVMVTVGFLGVTKADLQSHLENLIGIAAAGGLFHLVEEWRNSGAPLRGVFIDVAVFAIASARVMDQLQDAVDYIWGLKPMRQPTAWQRMKQRWFSRVMLLGIAFMLLASLTASAALTIGTESVIRAAGAGVWLIDFTGAVMSYIIVAGIFAGLYKWVPKAQVAWSNVWIGALLTAALYAAGSKIIVGYLGHSALVAFYGGAGSLIILLLWSYYASQIYLFGAIFIAVYASEYGAGVVPVGARAVRAATESDDSESSSEAADT
jgi:membrane protein